MTGEITELLRAASEGDGGAADALFLRVDGELRALARRELYRAGPRALRPTELVNGAFVRLFGREPVRWPADRRLFFATFARALHDLVIEEMRRNGRRRPVVELDESQVVARTETLDLLDLRLALERLDRVDARAAEVFRFRFFLGLEMDRVAEAVGVSLATAERDLRFARAWLRHALSVDEARRAGEGAEA